MRLPAALCLLLLAPMLAWADNTEGQPLPALPPLELEHDQAPLLRHTYAQLLAGGPKSKAPQSKRPATSETPSLKEATQQARSKAGSPYGTQTRQQLERSKRSYETLLREHEQKVAAYRKNPQAYDNEGRLQGQPPEVKLKIIEGRVKALEKQIAKHREELKKIEEALRALPREK